MKSLNAGTHRAIATKGSRYLEISWYQKYQPHISTSNNFSEILLCTNLICSKSNNKGELVYDQYISHKHNFSIKQ